MAEGDTPVETNKRKKGKGRGKGRGKGKGKGKVPGPKRSAWFSRRVASKRVPKEAEAQDTPMEEAPSAGPSNPLVPDLSQPSSSTVDVEQGGASSSHNKDKEAEVAGGQAPPEEREGAVDKSPVVIDYSEEHHRSKATTARPADSTLPKKSRQPKTRSPEEVLSKIQPPTCYIGLSATEHRFMSTMKAESKEFTGKMRQNSFSVSFARRPWKEALKAVHEFNWRKWHVCKKNYPLGPGQEEMTPGTIPEPILEQLQSHIDALPPLAVKAKQHKK